MSDELDLQVAALLRISREHEQWPSPQQKSRMLRSVLLSAATGVAIHTSTVAAKGWTTAWAVLSRLPMVGLALGFGTGMTAMILAWPVSNEEVKEVETAPRGSLQQIQVVPVSPSTTPPTNPTPHESKFDAASVELPKTPPSSSTSATEQECSAILAELRLLRAAQQSLQVGQPKQALRQLHQHDTRYGSGQFWAEKMAVRVLAHCELGHAQAARQAAAQLLASAPQSPLIPRIRASCAFSNDAPSSSGAPVSGENPESAIPTARYTNP